MSLKIKDINLIRQTKIAKHTLEVTLIFSKLFINYVTDWTESHVIVKSLFSIVVHMGNAANI